MCRSKIWHWNFLVLTVNASPAQAPAATRKASGLTQTSMLFQKGFHTPTLEVQAQVQHLRGILLVAVITLLQDQTRDLQGYWGVTRLLEGRLYLVMSCSRMRMSLRNGWHRWNLVFTLLLCPFLMAEMILNEYASGMMKITSSISNFIPVEFHSVIFSFYFSFFSFLLPWVSWFANKVSSKLFMILRCLRDLGNQPLEDINFELFFSPRPWPTANNGPQRVVALVVD